MRASAQSLQVRFVAISLLMVLILAGISVFLLKRSGEQLRGALQGHGSVTARQAAFALAPVVAFESKGEIEKEIAALVTDPDLRYVVVCGEEGIVLASYGSAPTACRGGSPPLETIWEPNQLNVRSAIVDGGKIWGDVEIGYSLRSIESQFQRMRMATGISASLAILLAVGMGWYLSRSVARPITNLATAVSQVGQGRLDTEIKFRSQDEVGMLAEAFRRMLSQLSATMVSREELRESEERYALAAKGSNDGLWDWDLRTGEVYFSARWKAVVGLPEEEPVSSPEYWLGRLHPADKSRVRSEVSAHIQGETRHFQSEHRLLHEDGTYRWVLCRGLAVRDQAGTASRMAGSLTDITAGKVADPLTGLPNRLYFGDLLERAFERCERQKGRQLAVLFLDMDRFKVVNDSLGHHVGDQLLIAFANRVRTVLSWSTARHSEGEPYFLARLGGDEFTILLDCSNPLQNAEQIAHNLQEALREPFLLNSHEIFASASIGIAIGPANYKVATDILRDADSAMYRAKARGKARHEVFDAGMHDSAIMRLRLETDLRRAVEQQAFQLHYQPIYELTTGQLLGFEALLRWPHVDRGLIPPGEFVPLAEETGLIFPLGEWVLREACRQMVIWQKQFAHTPPLFVSVNLSGRQLLIPTLAQQVVQILTETGLSPSNLKLEVTESVLMENPEIAVELLKDLRALGVDLAIDDFGTGYSSLSYLHNFPFSSLKIDRAFVSRLGGPEGTEVVRTIASLARNLGMHIVAEGVENAEQWTTLQNLGCESGQGFLFSRPLDSMAVTALLTSASNGLFNLAKQVSAAGHSPKSKPWREKVPSTGVA